MIAIIGEIGSGEEKLAILRRQNGREIAETSRSSDADAIGDEERASGGITNRMNVD